MPHDEPSLAANASAMRQSEKDALAASYRAMCAHPLASAALRDFFTLAGLFHINTSATDPSTANTSAIGVFEGKRRMALHLIGMTIGTQEAAAVLADAVAGASSAVPKLNGRARTAITENTETKQ